MSNIAIKRPKRLWIAVVMNILTGLLGLALIVLLLSRHPTSPTYSFPGSLFVWTHAALCLLLLWGSIFALLGKPKGNMVMLAVATIFFSVLILECAFLLGRTDELSDMLLTSMARFTLELAINGWAALSDKTRAFFASGNPVLAA